MDGDIAPLNEISALSKTYGANLIIDEAHATGVFGMHGKGLVQQLGLEQNVFARIVTFGKAIGCHGAIILGTQNLREFLINFARSFIYTTAAPLHNIISINCAYQLLERVDFAFELQKKIDYFTKLVLQQSGSFMTPSPSAIQTILFPGNSNARNAAQKLQANGIEVKPILSPTVSQGRERLRICLHLYNTDEEINNLVSQLIALKK
jgi:8-amino-7-oxononanoate synthase